MIAIKGRTQSWGCFRSRRAWRWQLIENANTQADEWEECWVYTAWKDYPPHFRKLGGGGGWTGVGNQTNWMWSIAVPPGRACCLLRQCDTADPRHRHNKTLTGSWKIILFEFTFATYGWKKLIYSIYIIVSIILQIYQFISQMQPFCNQSRVLLLPICNQIFLLVHKVLGCLKSTRK